jgi:hypothetical protein
MAQEIMKQFAESSSLSFISIFLFLPSSFSLSSTVSQVEEDSSKRVDVLAPPKEKSDGCGC